MTKSGTPRGKAKGNWNRGTVVILGAAIFLLMGCASQSPGKLPADRGKHSTVDGAEKVGADDWNALRESLVNPRDTLILDLLSGYRNLMGHAQGTVPLDAGRMQKAQEAAWILEAELRSQGGILSSQMPEQGRETLSEPRPGVDKAAPKTAPPDMGLSESSRQLVESHGFSAASDTLFNQGHYLEGWKVLLSASPEVNDLETRRERFGGRYCEEKRRVASQNFIEYRKVESLERKKALLESARVDLESCLLYFPEIFVSDRVKDNLKLVQRELEALNRK